VLRRAIQASTLLVMSGSETMSAFILIHGACRDGSAWSRVIDRLNKFGHRAFGPMVAGHEAGACRAVTHPESTRSIVDFVFDNDTIPKSPTGRKELRSRSSALGRTPWLRTRTAKSRWSRARDEITQRE